MSSKKMRTVEIKQEEILRGSARFLSGDIKKTDMRDQLFLGVNFDGFFNIFYTYPFIVPVPTVKSKNAVAIPIC